jgi:hypothetical protein
LIFFTLVGLNTSSINATFNNIFPHVNCIYQYVFAILVFCVVYYSFYFVRFIFFNTQDTLEYSSNMQDFVTVANVNDSVPYVIIPGLQTAYNYQFRLRIADYGSELLSNVFNGTTQDCELVR